MSWDHHLLLTLNRTLSCPFLDVLMAMVTVVTSPLPALGMLVGLAWRRRRAGVALLSAVVLSTLTAVGLQLLLGRPRPAGVRLVLPVPGFPSFPSGHAAGSAAAAVLAALLWRRARLPGLLGAVMVSLSRVYLGHHYPSDVLGGAILGTAVGLVVYGFAYRGSDCGRPRWAWLLWGQLAVVLLATLAASLGLIHFGFLALPGADKVLHFLLYGVVAFLAVAWWGRRWWVWVLAALALLALVEEVSQALVPGRSASLLDLGAALAGVALFGGLGRLAWRRHPALDRGLGTYPTRK
jgi:undecaprenyl-diphosphatase